MRKLSAPAVAVILAIALYFALFWGFEALRMLTSPTYGLDDVWRSQFVFEIGRLFALSPLGLIKLAAFFATLKLAVAAICTVHIADRFRALAGGRAEPEILEAGLLLALLICLASDAPAIWMRNIDLVREQTIQFMLAAVGVALCTLERSYGRGDADAEANPGATIEAAAAAQATPHFRGRLG
jgi:hypothetical protein